MYMNTKQSKRNSLTAHVNKEFEWDYQADDVENEKNGQED